MATRALFDLTTLHGPEEIDRAIGLDPQQLMPSTTECCSVDLLNLETTASTGVINLLLAAMEKDVGNEMKQSEDEESIHSVLGEGFAKLLLWSKQYPSMPINLHHLFLRRLITLYFSDGSKELQRLTQCLSVFFKHYPSLSPHHKRCVSRVFIPVMRSMWPVIYGNPGGSSVMVSKMRKFAVQASRFMLQMMQMPMLSKELEDEHSTEKSPASVSGGSIDQKLETDCREDGIAIRIAAEVLNYPEKKTSSEKSYIAALCRIVVLIQLNSEYGEVIKCMRGRPHTQHDAISIT